jgi:hypothetical protein
VAFCTRCDNTGWLVVRDCEPIFDVPGLRCTCAAGRRLLDNDTDKDRASVRNSETQHRLT